MSEKLNLTPGQTLAFFASVIKSGEPWTGTCQKAYDEAMAVLLSSPRVEEVRREALEEAAKIAEEMAVNRERVSAAAAYASWFIAKAIRTLSTG